jgi:hypothetical protein
MSPMTIVEGSRKLDPVSDPLSVVHSWGQTP